MSQLFQRYSLKAGEDLTYASTQFLVALFSESILFITWLRRAGSTSSRDSQTSGCSRCLFSTWSLLVFVSVRGGPKARALIKALSGKLHSDTSLDERISGLLAATAALSVNEHARSVLGWNKGISDKVLHRSGAQSNIHSARRRVCSRSWL